MMEQVKVLYFIDRLRRGGIQTLVLNLIEHFDREKVQVDFLLFDDGINYELEQVFRELGSKIYKVTWPHKNSIFKCMKELNDFFADHHSYNIIHAHSSSKSFFPLWYAKKYGIETRIAHSHNTKFQSTDLLTIAVGNCLKIPMCRVATDYFACSEIAGDWLFKHWYAKKQPVVIIKNGIEVEQFKYNEMTRKEVREELGVSDNLVIGNVGRFTHQKNHRYILQIFLSVLEIEPKAILLLVGEGELFEEIVSLSTKMGIRNRVIFLGFRNDTHRLMQSFDIFLMPSLYEGLPFVGVEAQAAGLPCVFSDTISQEINILKNASYLDITASPNIWAEKIMKIANSYVRYDTSNIINKAGFSIKAETQKLTEFYFEKIRSPSQR